MSSRIRRWLPLLIAVYLATPVATPAAAQWPDQIAPGTRVQARIPEVQYQAGSRRGHLLRGRITALAPDTLSWP